MKREGVGRNILFSLIGLVILIAGFVSAKLLADARGVLLTLPYVFIGIGAGIFGGNLGTSITKHHMKKNPQLARQAEIESKDERNITINYKAKAKAYELMQMVFGALILAFALMQTDLHVVLSLIAAYLFIVFSMLYYLNKYNKEM